MTGFIAAVTVLVLWVSTAEPGERGLKGWLYRAWSKKWRRKTWN